MKNISLLLFCASLMFLGCGFLKIGAPAPEFAKGYWHKGKSFSLASVKGKKMCAILFWKPDHSGARSLQIFSRLAHQRHLADKVAFAAVAEGSVKNVGSFPLIQQLGAIPLLIDTDKKTIPLFLRSENLLPMAVLIGSDGKLLWRGNPGRIAVVLNDLEKKT